MTDRFSCKYRVLIISLLILLCFSGVSYAFQTKISGTLNTVNARIETISGTNKVIVNDVTGFNPNDTVLVIQMQGVQITLSPTYGNPQGAYGTPGQYEFIIIQSVNVLTKEIVFYRDLLNTYDTRGSIQILKVPSYNSAEVTGVLTCNPWNSTTKMGGVLAMIVGKTLKLTANIDVSGKGFAGGANRIGAGLCSNNTFYLAQYYDSTFTNAGFKGEGVGNYTEFFQPVMPGYTKGQGPSWTGGGGGNARFSGGGGGSNRGSGGQGGNEDCGPTPLQGGSGGFIADHASLLNRIYMGGGGGASTSLSAALTSGGNGGGIVIIVSDTIIGAGGKIISNGASGGKIILANSGAGGGGAGGSIALSVNSYGSAPLGLSVKGGKGGDNTLGTFVGEGGGGGGGLLWISTNTTGNVTNLLNGGLAGDSTSSSGYAGTAGEKRLGFKAILNGFLFNSIRSSVTGDQIDSICSNVKPKKISGTLPVGGAPNYTYHWEKSYDKVLWRSLYTGPDSINYTPDSLETNTVYFRRTITDSSVPPLTDVSLPLKIIVQTAITGNSVGKDTIICFNQKPLGLVQSSGITLANGNGKYQYKWLQNTTNTNWNTSPAASGTYTDQGYNPPNLLTTTYYQRFVTSGRCIDYSPSVTITVLPSITGNVITRIADSVICEGYKFVPLNSSAPGGGNGTFYYKWQDSTSLSANYIPAVGLNNATSYSVDTSTFSLIEKRYLRRVVFSGPDSVCRSNSLPILLTRFHKLKNNLILSADTTIGYDTVPHILKARQMVAGDGGNGVFTYVWRSKTTTWGTAALIFNQQNYAPDSLKITTQYRRVVNSSVCTDTSSFKTVTVQAKILGNNIFLSPAVFEDTICYGLAPVKINGSSPTGGSAVPFDRSFSWFRSPNSTGPWTEIVGKTDSVYQPDTLHKTTYFRRYVSSPKISPRSIDKSNIIKITVLPLITNKDITPLTQAICFGSPIAPINSSATVSGGDNSFRYTWRQDSANTGWKNVPGSVKTTVSSYSKSSIKDPFRYIRYVYSGSNDCCADSSNIVTISINPLPTGNITPATDRICEGLQIPLVVNLTGKKPWNIKYTESATSSSQVSPPPVTSAISTIYRIPPTITSDSLAYTYSLYSVQDSNLCMATSLTVGLRKSTVYKYPDSHLNASFTADSICGHTYGKPMLTKKSRGSGTWTKTSGAGTFAFSPDANTWNASVTVDSTSAPWLERNVYNFKWKEVNWQCADSASVKIIFNKGTGSAHPGKSADLYAFGTFIDSLHAINPLAGSGMWTSTDNVKIVNPSDPKTVVTGLLGSSDGIPYHFKWAVKNGACISDSTITITSFDLIIPKGFSPDNGDNYNNTFIIKGLNTDPKNNNVTLRIVNSAGSEVFYQSNDSGWKDWDGKNNNGNDLPDGSYYYLLTVKSVGDASPALKWSGFIIIKRTKNNDE